MRWLSLSLVFATLLPHAFLQNERLNLLKVAEKYIGVKEIANNRSPTIDKWTRKWNLGIPWCAAFVSGCLDEAKVKNFKIRSPRARAFITKKSVTADMIRAGFKPLPGDILIWTRRSGGHIGIVKSWNEKNGYVVEGNTSCNKAGSQWNGGEVCLKLRNVNRPFSAFRITHLTRF